MAALLGLTAVCVVLAVVCPPQWQPWVQLAAAALVAAAGAASRAGRPVRSRRTGPRSRPVDVVDLVAPDLSLVGCVEGERVVTTAVEITAGALVPAEVGRDADAGFRGLRLPLAAIARQLDQGGVVLEGIDVVVRGRRAAPGPDGEVYAGLVGPLALVSRRHVHLLLRFDLADLASHPDVEPDAPLQQVVAVSTERLRRALVHHGVPCRVLDATELADRYLEAEEAAESAEGVGLVVRPDVDPREVADVLATVPAEEMTEVLRLRRVGRHPGVVDVTATLGLSGVDPDVLPSTAVRGCRPADGPGVLPVPGEELPATEALSVARLPVEDLDRLAPPAHGAGQILGATRSGGAAALQLAGPHLRSVLLAARPPVCRQVVFRAVASGYRVAVVTDVPDRWSPLRAVGDASRFRIVDPDASDAGATVDAVVWDVDGPLSEGRIDAFAGPGGPDVTPPTVIRVDADWDTRHRPHRRPTAPPDLVLDGRIDGWISVEPRVGRARRVSVVEGPGERAYVGRTAPRAPDPLTPAGAGPAASPDHP